MSSDHHSVHCQTDCSWLSLWKENEQDLNEKENNQASNEGSAFNKQLLNNQQTTAGREINVQHSDQLGQHVPYPPKDDEYGELLESKRCQTEDVAKRVEGEKVEMSRSAVILIDQLLDGKCAFCGERKKQFPIKNENDMLVTRDANVLYCCDEFRMHLDDVLTSSTPQQRILPLRMRQADRSHEEISSQWLDDIELTGIDETMDEDVTALNYELSSQRCLEEGWTLPVSDAFLSLPMNSSTVMGKQGNETISEQVDIKFEPVKSSNIKKGLCMHGQNLHEKYNNGKIFHSLFPDGTGSVFYPSGNLAISSSRDHPEGSFTYIILTDPSVDCDARIIAYFDMLRKIGVVFHENGNISILLNSQGGTLFTYTGTLLKKWKWANPSQSDAKFKSTVPYRHHFGSSKSNCKDNLNLNHTGMLELATHIHSPPAYPINSQPSRHLTLRILSQDDIRLEFFAMDKSCYIELDYLGDNNYESHNSVDIFNCHMMYLGSLKICISDILLKSARAMKSISNESGQDKELIQRPKPLCSRFERTKLKLSRKQENLTIKCAIASTPDLPITSARSSHFQNTDFNSKSHHEPTNLIATGECMNSENDIKQASSLRKHTHHGLHDKSQHETSIYILKEHKGSVNRNQTHNSNKAEYSSAPNHLEGIKLEKNHLTFTLSSSVTF